jgi:hypothetical protein
MFRFSSTASVTLVEVGWLAPCNAKPVRARRFSFETGSEPSRFFRSETPRTIAQPTETWLLDRYAQPRLFFSTTFMCVGPICGVRPEGLVALPWSQAGRSGVAFRAEATRATGAQLPGVVAAPKANTAAGTPSNPGKPAA